jgi:hypothetical protein
MKKTIRKTGFWYLKNLQYLCVLFRGKDSGVLNLCVDYT